MFCSLVDPFFLEMNKYILASLEGSLSKSSSLSLNRWIDHLSGDKNNYFSHSVFPTAILNYLLSVLRSNPDAGREPVSANCLTQRTFSAMITPECGSGNLQAIMVLAGTSSIKQRLSQVEILL